MKKKLVGLLLLACVPPMMGGCITFFTTMELVNNTDYPLHVSLYYSVVSSDQASVVKNSGVKTEFDVAPGETAALVQSCPDVQAVLVEDAQLSVNGSPGPAAGTQVYRANLDFLHGDTVIFTFTAADGGGAPNITFSRVGPPM
jgi:hypothetical protein